MDDKSLNNAEGELLVDQSSCSNSKDISECRISKDRSLECPSQRENFSNEYVKKACHIKNGSIDNPNCLINEVVSTFQNVNINSPSTSKQASNEGVEDSKSIPMNADNNSDDHSHYTTTICPNSNASVSSQRPGSLSLEKAKRRVLKITPEEISSPDSLLSDEENKFISPETDSQDELENSIMVILNNSQKSEVIPEFTLDEEQAEVRNWKACTIAGVKRQIDLKVIEPYKRVLSHGGYLNTGSHNAIITFSACFLPHKSRKDYNYVMDNLFFYIIFTLNQLVTDDYVLVYLHGGTTKDCIPKFSWLKRCYQMIDRKLKKNLKALYLVHPTFWLKTLVTMIKPFISTKFSRKIHFISCLTDLTNTLPIEDASIPDKVKQYDRIKMSLIGK